MEFLSTCHPTSVNLPTQTPADVDKIWTFTQTDTALIVACNGIVLLSFGINDTASTCTTDSSIDSHELNDIAFEYADNASDFIRPKPSSGSIKDI